MFENLTFFDLDIHKNIKENLSKIGFVTPTEIQKKTIPLILDGHDLVGQAQTGTGKTLAFALPLVNRMLANKDTIQGLVLCPTRELCLQVQEEIKKVASFEHAPLSTAIYGGQPIEKQMREIKKNKPQIIVATPGRLLDHLRRKTIDLSDVRMAILDEADEMLDMGFKEDITAILKETTKDSQKVFFSATMPKPIQELAHKFLVNQKVVKTKSQALSAKQIIQKFCRVSPKEKNEILARLLHYYGPKRAVVFCNAKNTIEDVASDISFRGFEAGVLHGDLSQAQRDRVMAGFRTGIVKILVATDVAARGIDVDDVEVVINYHLPHSPCDYVHRIGRTGRAGKAGLALSLVEGRDNSRLRKITQFAKAKIVECEPPTLGEVRSAMLAHIFSQASNALNTLEANDYLKEVENSSLNPKELAAGLLQMSFKKFDETKEQVSFFSNQKQDSSRQRVRNGSNKREFSKNKRFSKKASSQARGPRGRKRFAGGAKKKSQPRG